MLIFKLNTYILGSLLKIGVYSGTRMDVESVFQEYGTDIAQARVLFECRLCLEGLP